MGRFAIILVVGFAIIAGGMKMNHGRLGRQAQEISTDRYFEVKARTLTNSVIHLCLYQLAQDFGWRAGYQGQTLGTCGSVDATIVDASTDSTLSLNEVRITTTSSCVGESAFGVVRLSKSAYSEFAYFTDVEPVIYFITGDTLRGPIHTNGQFHIWGDPAFYGLVSSVASTWSGSGNPSFKAGTNFGTSRIDLPTDLSIIEGVAQSGGMAFDSDTKIEFLSDGSFDWEVYHEAGGIEVVDSSGNVDLSTINGVIATINQHDVRVKGTLDGQATILSDGDIWIDDDILYYQDPQVDPTADDMLGLISMHNIYVTDNVPNQSDCIIHATLMALDESFRVENYNQGTTRGTLIVLGGIVQETRGPVGTMRYGVIASGYQKLYIYDQRLVTKAPPHYPVYSKNVVVSWYE